MVPCMSNELGIENPHGIFFELKVNLLIYKDLKTNGKNPEAFDKSFKGGTDDGAPGRKLSSAPDTSHGFHGSLKNTLF